MVALDGLRGVAALAVVAYHAAVFLGLRGALTVKANIAVDFFFCLSGFVLAYAHDEQILSGKLGAGKFMLKRMDRFLPVTVIGSLLALASALYIGKGTASYDEFLCALSVFTLPFYSGAGLVFLNGTFWSLFYEMSVNALYAIAAKPLGEKGMVCLWLVSLIALCVSIVHFRTIQLLPTQWNTLGASLLRPLTSFFAGVLIFRMRARGVRLPKIGFGWLAAALLFPMVIPASAAIVQVPLSILYVAILIPAIVLAGSVAETSAPKTATALGDASFMLYGIHAPILIAATHMWKPESTIGKLGYVAVSMLALFSIALILSRRLEIPVLRWQRRTGIGFSRNARRAHAADV